ncbi:DUF748 domain-containing protein [Kushneria aurantia]|uniref:DUF748 domain-containing protein n=1 Tax=Kushneria aurantia TaxID=504092 RepID=A0ABV6FYG3_9GAMM|nr:DUF748 domain-containing protein [Kushneria aurantia]
MTSKARRGSIIAVAAMAVLVLVLYVAGPWALRKWAVNHFSNSLNTPVALEHLGFNPFTATAHFDGLRIGDADSPMLTVNGGEAIFQWSTLWQSGVHLDEIRLESPHLRLVSPPSGPLNVMRLGGQSQNDSSPLTVAHIRADSGRIDWIDQRQGGSDKLSVTNVDIALNGYSRLSDNPMQGSASGALGDGTLQLEGSFGLAPFTAELSISAQQVPLTLFPSLMTRALPVEVDDGSLAGEGTLTLGTAAENGLGYQGALQLSSLSLVSRGGQPLLNVDQASLSAIELVPGEHLRIARATLEAPELTALITDNGSFNLATVLGGGGDSSDRAASGTTDSATVSDSASDNRGSQSDTDGGATALVLQRLEVRGGRFRFEDRHMSPTVSLDVGSLNGQLTGLDTSSDAAADYHFEGLESDNTPVTIEGSLNPGAPLSAHMHLATQRLMLEQFAPYIQRFAGYRIEQGVADLDLDYRLRDGILTASNHIIVRRLALGQQVDQDASGLPLKNLIALLQAEDGTINLDIPIETDVDGSSVDISAVVWQAIRESLENLVTSPVDTLQALIGGSAEGEGGEGNGSRSQRDENQGSGENQGSSEGQRGNRGQDGDTERVEPAADGYQGGPLSGVSANPPD